MLTQFCIALTGAFLSVANAQNAGPVPFLKKQINAQFYSEGIHFGDVNKDGIADIVSGPYWYAGPSFTQKQAFRTPRTTPFDIIGDSDCYANFVYDFNQDGWMDILSMRLPGGVEAVWYENPKGAATPWVEHLAFTTAENESATFTDIDGDGKPELITNSQGFGGWAKPDWTAPNKLWTFKAVTAKGTWGAFTHGIGVGDINGDGKQDLLFPTGWWEQPATASDLPWINHPGTFGGQAAPLEGFGGSQMFAYDVDGDGDNDIVTALQAHGWGLAWFENQDQGKTWVPHLIMNTKTEEAEYGVAFAQLHALAVADVDGDGLKDIITGKRKGAHGKGLGAEVDAAAVLYWFKLIRSPGKLAGYQPFLIDSIAGVGTQLTVADVNGDRSPDILTARRDGAFVFMNQKVFPTEIVRMKHGRKTFFPYFWRIFNWDLLGKSKSK
jgi:hypothetical protein